MPSLTPYICAQGLARQRVKVAVIRHVQDSVCKYGLRHFQVQGECSRWIEPGDRLELRHRASVWTKSWEDGRRGGMVGAVAGMNQCGEQLRGDVKMRVASSLSHLPFRQRTSCIYSSEIRKMLGIR